MGNGINNSLPIAMPPAAAFPDASFMPLNAEQVLSAAQNGTTHAINPFGNVSSSFQALVVVLLMATEPVVHRYWRSR
jgi:hypothetical protein